MNTNITKWAFILSIIIIANLFFNYSLSLFLNNPQYDEFCSYERSSQIIEDKESCLAVDGIWQISPKSTMSPSQATVEEGYCDLYTKCNQAYEESAKIYEQKAFIGLVIIGVVVLLGSLFISSNPVLSSALALTAVLNFIVASMRYWRYSDELLKVAILFIALVTLIYLVVKKFKN